ncbi:amidohydrolase [Clostridium sp. AM58-1XD]|uniref:amidohydrolase n=1 Tax=Clostridium sp. AM58-1XD TaxID=2292307 RepID=UPI000E4E8D92|nr:amidohydrolase [Clostridium sp. AM58-1XD]RGY98701.1 amidohydrolase [Clostridium sp. AM58-1XD]
MGNSAVNDRWQKILDQVDGKRELIYEAAQTIWKNPEIGYKEWKTTKYLEGKFEELGYKLQKAENIPGFTAQLDTGRPGPVIAVIGELDSLICDGHPDADQETKAVHACGHNCQPAYLLGVAAAFAQEGMTDGMSGSIRFVAVPAEETIDLEYRSQLIKKGIISYVAGKIEFLYRGLLDGVDMAFMMHADTGGPHLIEVFDGCDGCITKHIEFEGKAAHAGVAPHEGINALYEASIGMQACNALRETFRDEDHIRFHPIVTQAGVAANAIPSVAKMDAYCRAAAVDVMIQTNGRINRALAASAAAFGGNVHIMDKPGNLPLHNSKGLNDLFARVSLEIFGPGSVHYGSWQASSCDMGDLSSIMPVAQPMMTGAKGTLHGKDFRMDDLERLCLNPARVISISLHELLSENAKLANEIVEGYQPVFASKEEYFEAVDAIAWDERAVVYNDDGSVLLRVK